MGKSFRTYYKKIMNKILRLIWWLFFVQLWLLFFFLVFSHMLQLVLPRAYWYTYEYVKPAKETFATGEPLYMESKLLRRRLIDTQWQDTLFCNNWSRTKKYTTQFRPPAGKEKPKVWNNKSQWLYNYPILESEIECKMCWVVVAETEYWYNKDYKYCTELFGVNWNAISD